MHRTPSNVSGFCPFLHGLSTPQYGHQSFFKGLLAAQTLGNLEGWSYSHIFEYSWQKAKQLTELNLSCSQICTWKWGLVWCHQTSVRLQRSGLLTQKTQNPNKLCCTVFNVLCLFCRTRIGNRLWLMEKLACWTSWILQVRRNTVQWGTSTWGQGRDSSACSQSTTQSPLRTFINTGVAKMTEVGKLWPWILARLCVCRAYFYGHCVWESKGRGVCFHYVCASSLQCLGDVRL